MLTVASEPTPTMYLPSGINEIACINNNDSTLRIASLADALWGRHGIFPTRWGKRLRDEPKERLRGPTLRKYVIV